MIALINRAFSTLALGAGRDKAILDPLDRELRAALLAAELVLGRTTIVSTIRGPTGPDCSTERAQRPVVRGNRPCWL